MGATTRPPPPTAAPRYVAATMVRLSIAEQVTAPFRTEPSEKL